MNKKNTQLSQQAKKPFQNFWQKEATQSILSSLLCILAGILIGFVVMLIIALASNGKITVSDAFSGLATLLFGPFSSGSARSIVTNFGDMIFYASPLIMTGLSVAIAFKTGLFNIGAPGQFLMGTAGSLAVALSLRTEGGVSGLLVWFLAVLTGVMLGMIWGAIPGLFKAMLGVNEVIVCIMTNWIAANLVSYFFSIMPDMINTGHGKSGYLITTRMTGNGTPKLGLDMIFKDSYIDMSFLIAVLIAVVVYIVINKTTFGYELKACGYNRNAAKYAGMNEKRNIILSMAIAGGLAALGGALYYLNPGIEFKFSSAYSKLPDYGFNGIPVALLASNNPIGVIFSGLFLRYLGQGGDNLVSCGYNRYISDIIIALTIYFAGFSKLIRSILKSKIKAAVATTTTPEPKQTTDSTATEADNQKKEG